MTSYPVPCEFKGDGEGEKGDGEEEGDGEKSDCEEEGEGRVSYPRHCCRMRSVMIPFWTINPHLKEAVPSAAPRWTSDLLVNRGGGVYRHYTGSRTRMELHDAIDNSC